MPALFKDGAVGTTVERQFTPSAAFPTTIPLTIECFVPAPIAELDEPIGLTDAGRFARADAELRALTSLSGAAQIDSAARPLLRSEAVSSSRIEGVVLGHRRLAKAARHGGHDPTAQLVLANLNAVVDALAAIDSGSPIDADLICELHATLLASEHAGFEPGHLRSVQNWIGGSASGPARAEFVPPPPEFVPPLIDDLCRFAARDDLPATLQAAIAHAQFETIHPFTDGNGRIGRILTLLVLRRRGLIPVLVPPLSLVMLAHRDRYVTALQDYRFRSRAPWLELFGDVCLSASTGAAQLAASVLELQDRWRRMAGRPRSGSAAATLLARLPEVPVIDLAVARDLTGRSSQACLDAISRLTAAGVLAPTTSARSRRVWECVGLFALLDDLERRFGMPGGGSAITNT